VAYATHVAEQIWPTDRAVNVGLCAGLPGLAVLLRMQALLSGVAGLARGGPAVFSVGILVGAAIATAGIAVLFWFASVPLGARRRVLGLVLIWIAWARCVAKDDLNIELGAWRALLFDVHNCARSVDTLTSAVG